MKPVVRNLILKLKLGGMNSDPNNLEHVETSSMKSDPELKTAGNTGTKSKGDGTKSDPKETTWFW